MSARTLALLAAIAVAVAASPAPATPFAYVGSQAGGSPSVKVIDTATDTVVATIPVDTAVGGVAVSPDGSRVYVTPYSIKVIDTSTNTVAATIPNLGTTYSPTVSPDGTRLYVGNFVCGGCDDVIQVIDTATNTQVSTWAAHGAASEMRINPAGTRLYVLHGNNEYITVIDTATGSAVASISGGGLDSQRAAITPDGTKLYVGPRTGAPIAVVDTATNTVVTTIPIANGSHGMAVNPAGTRLYVTAAGTNVIYVIDVASDTLLTTVNDGCDTGGAIAVTPAGTRAYFHGDGCDNAERILDTASNTVVGSVPVGTAPTGQGLYIGPICPNACSDGNPCTNDSCNLIGGCGYSNNTAPCASDGNQCTDDVCDGAGNCAHPNSSAGSSCSDGLFCNGTDACDGSGGCTNHTGDPCAGGPECAQTCNEAGGNCFDPVTTPCTSDGNVCTDDHCDGAGACMHSNNTAPCDDGVFCNGTDVCSGGACTHSGDPCTGGPQCAQTCNEVPHNCFDPAGSACASDGNPCTLDRCDGAGACAHPAGNPGAACRAASGQCDVAETCTGTSTACPADAHRPDGFPCNDGDACTNPDVCTAGTCTSGAAIVCALCETCDTVGGCIEAPRPSGCKRPTKALKASILLQDRTPDDLDQVKWKWSSGQATTFAELGNPLATDDYALCVYDATSSLLFRMLAPAGGTCGTKPCWKQVGPPTLGQGYKYKDVDGLPNDLDSMTLKSGLDGKAKVSLKGKGGNIPMPALGSLALPLTAQLQSENGTCWEMTTTTPSSNTTALFKAKGD
jgi:YVTN family beta-propeller protein